MKADERARARMTAPAWGCAPVNAGPWWLGYNEAREGLPFRPDYVLQTSIHEYTLGYRAGRGGTP
jgi:hypothetical protein